MRLLPEASLFERLLSLIVVASARHAIPVLVGAFALSAAALSYTVHHFSINTDTDEMINPRLQFRQEYEHFKTQFPAFADSFVIVVDAPTPEGADAAVARLVERLDAEHGQFKAVYAPGQGEFYQKNGLLFLSTEALAKLTNKLAQAQPILQPLAERPAMDRLFSSFADFLDQARANKISADGFVPIFDAMSRTIAARIEKQPAVLSWQGVLGPDDEGATTRRFVIIQPVFDYSHLSPAKIALQTARAAAAATASELPEATFRFTGKAALGAEELNSVKDGSIFSTVLSFTLVATILVLGARSVGFVVSALATLFMGLLWTTAFALIAIGQLNIVSIAFAALFVGMGIDYAIHVGLRYQEHLLAGDPHLRALRQMAATSGIGLLLGAPATALGFYVFAPTDYRGLGQLGIIAGTGIFIALIAALTVLPALLTIIPFRSHTRRLDIQLAGVILKRRRMILAGTLILAAVSIAFLPLVRFDFDPIRLKDPKSPAVATYLSLARDKTTTPYTLQVLAKSDDEAHGLVEKLKALPQVARVVWVDSFVPKDQDAKQAILSDAQLYLSGFLDTDIDPALAVADTEREALSRFRIALAATAQSGQSDIAKAADRLASQFAAYASEIGTDDAGLTGLRDALTRYLPAMLIRLQQGLTPEPVARETLPDNLKSRYVAADGTLRLEVFPAADASDPKVLRDFVTSVVAISPSATGSARQLIGAGDVVSASMRQATVGAIVIIAIFLLLALRRISDVLLVVFPISLAALVTTASTVWLNVPFNFANVITLPLLIGMGVTASLQLVRRWRLEGDEFNLFESSTPRAVMMSALTTMASFLSLAFASHKGMASMGILLTNALITTLFATVVFLPALLGELSAWRQRR